jgi:hypothetical protein
MIYEHYADVRFFCDFGKNTQKLPAMEDGDPTRIPLAYRSFCLWDLKLANMGG